MWGQSTLGQGLRHVVGSLEAPFAQRMDGRRAAGAQEPQTRGVAGGDLFTRGDGKEVRWAQLAVGNAPCGSIPDRGKGEVRFSWWSGDGACPT